MIIDGQDANLGWRCHFDLLANNGSSIPVSDRRAFQSAIVGL
jgi:hypothetical protein